MAKELTILEQVSRIREMMGLNDIKSYHKNYIKENLIDFNNQYGRLLMEATIPPKGAKEGAELVLKSLFGDEVAERFARSAADEWESAAKQLAETIEKEGLDDIGKFVDILKIQKGGAEISQEVLEDAMRKYMRSNPEVLENILKNSEVFLNKVLGETTALARIRAVNPVLADEIQNITTHRLDASNAATYKQDYDDLADLFRNSGLDMNDPDNAKILNSLESKSDMADAFGGTSRKPVNDEAVPLVDRSEIKTDKTAQQLADEEAERAAREAQEAESERIRKAQEDAETNLLKEKDQKVQRALDTLMAAEGFDKAWSFWVDLLTKMGFKTSKAKLIARAKEIFGEMTIRDLDNITRTQKYTDLVNEVQAKAKSRGGTADKIAKNVDGASNIIGSLTKLLQKIPGGKITLALIGGAGAFVFLNYMFEDTMFDFSDNWRIFKDWLRDNKFGDFIYGPRDKDTDWCLRQLNGYYDIPDEDRHKIYTVGLTCENINPDNFETYVSKIEYLKGGTVLDSSGNKVTKKDRFKITMGDNVFEKEVGSSTTNTSSTTTTTTAAPSSGDYENNKNGFIKWVQKTKGPNAYGDTYEWDDAISEGVYYENGGNVGTSLTYKNKTVGWE